MLISKDKLLRLGDLFRGEAYIAGEGEGIVTINGVAAVRQVVALEQESLTVAAKTWSFPDGSYLLPNLDKTKQYIVFAYDFKGDYEPVAYSHIAPFVRGDWVY